MIESCVLEHLRLGLSGPGSDPVAPVGMEVPNPLSPTYVVIEKTGSGESNGLFSATVAIQSVAPTLYRAAVLNDYIKKLMRLLPRQEKRVFRVECDSDYNFSDPSTKQKRYQAVFDIWFIE